MSKSKLFMYKLSFVLSIIIILLAVLLFFVNVFVGLLFALLGIFLAYASIKGARLYSRGELDEYVARVKENNKHNTFMERNALKHSPRVIRKKVNEFVLAGAFNYQKEIDNIFREYGEDGYFYSNYDKNDYESIVAYEDGVYEFEKLEISCELEREPDNQFDPNAIKVMYEGVLIGYVPKKATDIFKDFNKCKCELFGGKIKYFDEATEKVVKDTHDYAGSIFMYEVVNNELLDK